MLFSGNLPISFPWGRGFRVLLIQPFLHLLSPTLLRGRGVPDPQEGIWGILSCDTFAEPQDYGSSDQVLGLKAVGLGTGCCGVEETGTFSEMVGSTVGTLLPDPNQLPT